MKNRFALERLFWWLEMLWEERYPKSSQCAEIFECDLRTVSRDIEFLRDRLRLPVAFDREYQGYFFTEKVKPFYGLLMSQEEIMAMLMAGSMLQGQTGKFAGKISQLIESHIENLGDKQIVTEFRDKITFLPQAVEKVDEENFMLCLTALVKNQVITANYFKPFENRREERTISPQHLMNLNGNWYLISYCHKNEDLRNFMPGRMEKIRFDKKIAYVSYPQDKLQSYVASAFGAFKGDVSHWAVLLFSRRKAAWVERQHWHEVKKIIPRKDGQLELHLPIANFQEIFMLALQHGSDVEVLSPPDLREMVKEEIKKMNRLYQKDIS